MAGGRRAGGGGGWGGKRRGRREECKIINWMLLRQGESGSESESEKCIILG